MSGSKRRGSTPTSSTATRDATVNDDWNHALIMVGSEDRAPVLVEALQATPDPAGKQELLRDWFNSCEAIAPVREELRAELELSGFFTDAEDDRECPQPPFVVYRAAWEDDEAELALSWTTDHKVAERFCKGLVSLRAMFLGIYREDVDAYVWRGVCHAMYGYLTGRGESEVIAKTISGVHAISVLVREGKE